MPAITTESVSNPEVAVIIAVPVPFTLTFPFSSTDTISLSELLNATDCKTLSSLPSMLKVSVVPT